MNTLELLKNRRMFNSKALLNPELVKNGDIETSAPTINGQTYDGFSASSTISTDQAFSGTHSMKSIGISGAGFLNTFLPDPSCIGIGLAGGAKYKYSAYIYIPSGQSSAFNVEIGYSTDGVSFASLDSMSATDVWTKIGGIYTCNLSHASPFVLGGIAVDVTGLIFYSDNISIREY